MSDQDDNYDYPDEQFIEDPFQSDYKQDIKFGYKDLERIGQAGETWQILPSMSQDEMRSLSPTDRFTVYVQNILIHDKSIPLQLGDKEAIIGKIDKVNWVQYKVPLLYVAGYYIWKNKFRLNPLLVIKDKIDNSNLTLYDVVKYGRYWEHILSKI